MPPNDNEAPKTLVGGRRGAVAIAAALLVGGLAIVGLDRLVVTGSGDGKTGVAELAAGGPAVAADASSFSDPQKRDIEKIVKDYLLANPEIFLEVQGALEAKMEKEQSEKFKAAIAENAKEIYRHPNAAVAGNPNGDITIVEFFDYNCGYCKRAFEDVAKLVEKDKTVRVVFAELPIIRDESEPVSRIALAARLQGKYWEVHRELIATKGLVNEAVALKIAEKAGLDMTRLKADMNSDDIKNELERVKSLAKKMGINGTPHFLVGDRTVGGAPENLFELLEAHVAELRKSGCSYC
ncbi:MAG: DsbA family protein [Hyphomicrobium sp.]